MTEDEAVSAIAGALQVLEVEDGGDRGAAVSLSGDRPCERACHKNIARKTAGSGWRQGVIAELHQQDFPRP